MLGSQHKGIDTGKIPEGPPGSPRIWYVCREMSKNLGDPVNSWKQVDYLNRNEKDVDDLQGVGSLHSTLRAGEPFTRFK